ncbi:hypothetical protein TEA_028621 [Camellia sinensis var. sinensis]|uniref:RRM domain-containing protein n=1 Tax=Camellia sinensis var. sinensis TaxID=542762 RepID=A0A4S4DGZ4_CAMSN|nr:hypothetical protein TEA_028621 [Camellia sinensis var. sinensis]
MQISLGLGVYGILLVLVCGLFGYRANTWKKRKGMVGRGGEGEKMVRGRKALDVKFVADMSDCLDKYKVFGIEELRQATNGFDERWVIQGSVYKGCIDGVIYAIKKIKWNACEELKILQKRERQRLIYRFVVVVDVVMVHGNGRRDEDTNGIRVEEEEEEEEYEVDDVNDRMESSRGSRFNLLNRELELDYARRIFSRENVIKGIKDLSKGLAIHPDNRYHYDSRSLTLPLSLNLRNASIHVYHVRLKYGARKHECGYADTEKLKKIFQEVNFENKARVFLNNTSDEKTLMNWLMNRLIILSVFQEVNFENKARVFLNNTSDEKTLMNWLMNRLIILSVFQEVNFENKARVFLNNTSDEKTLMNWLMNRLIILSVFQEVNFENKARVVWVARRPPGYAFIDFDDRRDATDAIRELDDDNQSKFRWYRAWTKFILVWAVYSSFFTPMEFGFFRGMPSKLFLWDIAGQVAFLVDIVLQFFVAYRDSQTYKMVYKRTPIALRYLKSNFVFDLLSCMPWDVIYKVPLFVPIIVVFEDTIWFLFHQLFCILHNN